MKLVKKRKYQKKIVILMALPILFNIKVHAASETINNGQEKLVNSLLDMGTAGTISAGNTTSGSMIVTAGGNLTTNLLSIGRSGGDGLVNIIDGGIINITNNNSFSYPLAIGGNGDSANTSQGTVGRLNIIGTGSQLILNAGPMSGEFSVGSQGAEGLLTVMDGGKLDVTQGELWVGSRGSNTTKGTVTVDGLGSEIYSNGRVLIGTQNEGYFEIRNAGALKTDSDISVGRAASTLTTDNTLTISGAGSLAQAAGLTSIGYSGKGTVVVSDQAKLSTSSITIAEMAGSIGELAIGSRAGEASTAAGTIETPTILFGRGQASLTFNHTNTDYVFTPAISGTGNVNVLSGTTLLSGANTYIGTTTIADGATLQAGTINSFSPQSNYLVESGGILDLNNHNQTLASLTSSGTVILSNTPAGTGTQLTISNTLSGNSIFKMQTNLLSGYGDLILVTGTSSGSHYLDIQNNGATNSTGTETLTVVKTADGNATFGLLNNREVEVGGYLYNVRQSGTDWELYASGEYTPPVTPPILPIDPPVDPIPVDPSVPVPPRTPVEPILPLEPIPSEPAPPIGVPFTPMPSNNTSASSRAVLTSTADAGANFINISSVHDKKRNSLK